MGKNANLNSGEWCELIFEDKNKKYGAYKLRQSSSKRHIAAFIVMVLLSAVIAVIPTVVSFMQEQLAAGENLGQVDEAYELTNLEVEPEVPEENIIQQEAAPPPPPLKSSIKFTPPVIVEDDKVKEENKMKDQDEVLKAKEEVSVSNIFGSDDKDAVNIEQLEQNKVIVEKKPEKEEPFVTVEQMPTYPGGELEMQKYIMKNLRYPVSAQERAIQGRVTVRFVVTKTGAIDNVQVLRGIDPKCDEEAMRVVRSMKGWIPGKQNGQAVPVYFTLPITFRLQQR